MFCMLFSPALILREIQHYDVPKKSESKAESAGAGAEESKGSKEDAPAESKGIENMDDVSLSIDLR